MRHLDGTTRVMWIAAMVLAATAVVVGLLFLPRKSNMMFIQLTRNPAEDFDPVWSPDSQRIAFTSSRDGSLNVYLLTLRQDVEVNLSDSPANDEDPAWSPDGRYVAFVSYRDDPDPENCAPCNSEIYLVDTSGLDGEGTPLEPFNLSRDEASDTTPIWSPDGTSLAFVSNREGNQDVYLADVEAMMGEETPTLTRLTDLPGDEYLPAWSPDSKKIAFTYYVDEGFDIFVVDTQTGGLTQLTTDPAPDSNPVWSPNGDKILFTSKREDDQYEIFSMHADGSHQTRLTHDAASKFYLSWSPDGERILFGASNGSQNDVFVIRPDGSDLLDLTPGKEDGAWPAWSPDGVWIAFVRHVDANSEIYIMPAPEVLSEP